MKVTRAFQDTIPLVVVFAVVTGGVDTGAVPAIGDNRLDIR